MPTPFPTSLSDRLQKGAWRDALPPHGPALSQGRAFQVRNGSADALKLRALIEVSHRAGLALAPSLGGSTEAAPVSTVSLLDAHGLLDRLEEWAFQYASYLTWPSSQHGWNDALRATIDADDTNGLATLLGTFPSQVRWALKDQPSLPTKLGDWWRGQTASLTNSVQPMSSAPVPSDVAALASPVEASVPPALDRVDNPPTRVPTMDAIAQRVPATSNVSSANAAPVALPTMETVRSERTERVIPSTAEKPADKPTYQDPRVDETFAWVQQLVERLKNDAQSMGVKQEWLDEQLKNRPTANITTGSGSKAWFEEQWLPAIARLDDASMNVLLQHWPHHRRFNVPSPVDMVSQARFWSILKNASDPVRAQMYDQALPRMLDMSKVTFDERLTMAQHMLEWAKRNPDLFRQRLTLWSKWGGSVSEEEVLSQTSESSSADVFNPPAVVRRSVARWILEQGNPMWNEQLSAMAQQHRWALPTDVVPVAQEPSVETSSSPSRRFRPR